MIRSLRLPPHHSRRSVFAYPVLSRSNTEEEARAPLLYYYIIYMYIIYNIHYFIRRARKCTVSFPGVLSPVRYGRESEHLYQRQRQAHARRRQEHTALARRTTWRRAHLPTSSLYRARARRIAVCQCAYVKPAGTRVYVCCVRTVRARGRFRKVRGSPRSVTRS